VCVLSAVQRATEFLRSKCKTRDMREKFCMLHSDLHKKNKYIAHIVHLFKSLIPYTE
jgi:hypothetical protein